MLSKELEFTLNQAFKSAREKQHEFMTIEHLLLALVEDPDAAEVMNACLLLEPSLAAEAARRAALLPPAGSPAL